MFSILDTLRQSTKLSLQPTSFATPISDGALQVLPSQPIAASLRLELLEDPALTIPALEALAADLASADYRHAWVKILSTLHVEVVFVNAEQFSGDVMRCEASGTFFSPELPLECTSLASPEMMVAINTTRSHRIAHSRMHSRTDSLGFEGGISGPAVLQPAGLASSAPDDLSDKILEFPLTFAAPATCGPGLLGVVITATLPADSFAASKHQVLFGTLYREVIVRDVISVTSKSCTVCDTSIVTLLVRNCDDKPVRIVDVGIDLASTWVDAAPSTSSPAEKTKQTFTFEAASDPLSSLHRHLRSSVQMQVLAAEAEITAMAPHRCGATPLRAVERELIVTHMVVLPFATSEPFPIELLPQETFNFAFRIALHQGSAYLAEGDRAVSQQLLGEDAKLNGSSSSLQLMALLRQRCVSTAFVVSEATDSIASVVKLTNVEWSLKSPA